MVAHNNVLPNAHFKKKWGKFVRTWFNQPARKIRRRTGAMPVVHPPLGTRAVRCAGCTDCSGYDDACGAAQSPVGPLAAADQLLAPTAVPTLAPALAPQPALRRPPRSSPGRLLAPCAPS